MATNIMVVVVAAAAAAAAILIGIMIIAIYAIVVVVAAIRSFIVPKSTNYLVDIIEQLYYHYSPNDSETNLIIMITRRDWWILAIVKSALTVW